MASLISLARNVTSAVASSTLAQNATLGATPITQDPAVLSAIPGAWNIDPCTESTQSRCFITCRTTDTVCQSAASSFVGTCEADWESYFSIQSGQASTESGWDYTTTVAGSAGSVIPTTVESYTTFSTATESFVKQNADLELTTLTPVYALGTPVLIETITTVPDYRNTYTVLTGPEPTCKYYSVFTMDPEDCGQCTIRGGTVDLLFWPPTTATVSDAGAPPMSTVVNGSTLISPSAYIHLRTILASNSCSRVGKEYTATMLAMDPEAISTQIHIGGKVAAYEYGQLDYADLTGLPPASEYEMQPSCVMFGCETIYSTTFFPTLKVPEQVRSIDPEWADCGLGLEGLYDPPIALQPKGAAAAPTQPSAAEPEPTRPSPGSIQQPPEPTTTSSANIGGIIASIIGAGNTEGTSPTQAAGDGPTSPNPEPTQQEAGTVESAVNPTVGDEPDDTSTNHRTSQGSVSMIMPDDGPDTVESHQDGQPTGTSALVEFDPPQTTQHLGGLPGDDVYVSASQYFVGTERLVPGSAITTLDRDGNSVTYSMFTEADGDTKLVLGTSTTLGAATGHDPDELASSTSSSDDMPAVTTPEATNDQAPSATSSSQAVESVPVAPESNNVATPAMPIGLMAMLSLVVLLNRSR